MKDHDGQIVGGMKPFSPGFTADPEQGKRTHPGDVPVHSIWRRLAAVPPFLLAAAVLAAATLLRMALTPMFGSGYTFITFYPATMFCTVIAGWRYGLAAMLASALLTVFLFIDPFTNVEHATALVVFFIVDGVMIVIADATGHARRQAEIQAILALRHEQGLRKEIEARTHVETSLRESEARFRTMAEAVPSFLFETDASGWNTWTSEGWCRFTGQTSEQVAGHGWAEALHPEDRAANIDRWLQCMKDGVPFEAQQRLRRVDGSYAWVIARALPVRDDQGMIRRWVGSVTDVDAIMRAEEDHARLAAIVASTSDAIIAKDLRGTITNWNRGAESVLGYTADETVGRPVTMLFPSDRVDEEQTILDRLRQDESILHYETVRRHKDGREIPVSLTISTIKDQQGRVIGASKILRDITERKQAEEALRESQVRLAGMVTTAMDAIISTDARQRITLFNTAAEQMFGLSATDAIGQPLDRFLPERYRKAHGAHVAEFGRTGVTARRMGRFGTIYGLHTDGREFPIEASISQLEINGEKLYTVILRDVTDRVRHDALLAEQQQLLERIAGNRPTKECFDALTEAVTRLHPTARAALLIANADRSAMDNAFSVYLPPTFGNAIKGAPINELPIGTCGTAIHTGLAVTCPDIEHSGPWAPIWRELCHAHGIKACHSQPVFGHDGVAIASFFLCLAETGEPTEWERRIAEFGSHIAGIVIERDRVEEALRDRNRQLDLLARTAHRLLTGREAEGHLLESVFRDIAGMIDTEMFYHYRPSDQPGLLRLDMHGGVTEEDQSRFATMRYGELLCGRVAERRKRIIVEDLQHCDHPGSEVLRAAGATSYAGFPLLAEGELIGTIAFISTRRTHLRDGDVQMIQTVCDQLAITLERARLERELRASEERLRLALEGADLGSWDVDVRTGAAVWNRRHALIQGYEPEHGPVTMEQWRKLLHPDDLDRVMTSLERAKRDHTSFVEEHRIYRADTQELRWLSLYGRFTYDEVDEPVRLSGVSLDITERKQAEQALLHAQERLQRWSKELEQAVNVKTAELTQSRERLRALATELNLTEQRERKRLATELHDHLQQMLVLGKLEIGQGKRLLAGVRANEAMLQRVDDILSDALTYTRTLVTELSPPVLRDHGLAAGIKWLAEYMKKKHGQTVTVIVPEDDELPLPEDQVILLFQCTRELLINSSKHAGTAKATAKVEQRNGYLRIEVTDQGKGFDLDAVAAAGTPSGGISSKFGLFSIQERMLALGGSFDIQSVMGKGTAATLKLPLRDMRLPNDESQTLNAQSLVMPVATSGSSTFTMPQSKLSSTRVRVLLVDDHMMVRQGLRAVLDAYADVELIGEATDGEEGLSMVHKHRPGVVVMDINMPKMNGIEATEEIKNRYPETIVIGLSVNADSDNQEAMLKAGALRLMTKEAAVEQLHDAIIEAVGR